MIRLRMLFLTLAAALLWQAAAHASGDAGCAPTWKLDHRGGSGCDGMALLGPGNDTRVNLMLFLFDLRGKPPAVAAPQDPLFEWAAMKDLLFPRPEGANDNYAYGEGSRCLSNAQGTAAFEAAVNASRATPDERQRLIAARHSVEPNCSSTSDTSPVTPPLPNLKSADARGFGTYLQGAAAFYDGDFDRAVEQFSALKTVGQPWLKETAWYMLGRTEVNRAQIGAFDEYGYAVNSAKISRTVIAAAEAALQAYVAQFPKGLYAASARGLLRRVYWLGGERDKLSALYGSLLAQAAATRGIDDVSLIEEIDTKLLPDLKPGEISDPTLLAVADLQRMRGVYPDSSGSDGSLPIAELEAQRPKFADHAALFDYLLAARAYFVANDPREAMRLIPDAARQNSFTYLQLSRQMLRGMALEALGDPNARGFWIDLLGGAKSLYQRSAVELALAWHDERAGALDKVFAPGSPVRTPAIREILLMNVAGPQLLRQQARDAGAPRHERELALFTLLYKDLTRGAYGDFGADLALVPAHASAVVSYGNPREEEHPPTRLFVSGHASGDYGCPALKKTAAALAVNPEQAKARLCVAEFMRINGFDGSPLETPPPHDELGGMPSQFAGGPFSRLEIYKAVMASAAATANDKAFALVRAINCYGPSGYNSCGGVDVPVAQRKAWFTRLKGEFGATRWAKEQKYYW